MTKPQRLVLFSILAVASALAWQQQRAAVKLPPPFHTESANNRPQVIPRPNGAQITLPQGFQTEEFVTEGFKRPRFMVLGPSGEIVITDTVAGGSVSVLVDKNRDFKIDDRKTLIENLDRPYGLAFWKEYLYVAEPTSVKRYKYDPKAMSVGAGEEVVSYPGMGKGHNTRTLLFNRQGTKLYVTVGSESNVSPGEPKERAAINEYNPDGTGHQIYASGVRNTVGLRWYPNTDTMWAAVQERDQIGDDLVPDYFTSIKRGGFYGWPFSYIGPNEDPRNKGQATDLVSKTIVPDVVLGAHVAVLDFIFYTGKMFPAEYQGGALIAQHGSWNRSKRVGYNVMFIPFKGGRPAGEPREFMGGFMLSPDKREVWGRPVGLLQLADGSVLLTDDGGNKIWRITYKR